MEDYRKQAEELVAKIYISDEEWKEVLIDTYEEIFRLQRSRKQEKPHLVVLH